MNHVICWVFGSRFEKGRDSEIRRLGLIRFNVTPIIIVILIKITFVFIDYESDIFNRTVTNSNEIR